MTMKRYRSIILILIIALVTTCMPVTFVSAKTKTKKMTVYNHVVVSGKYAYCSYRVGITRINLRTGKRKVLTKGWGQYGHIHSMSVRGNFVYFVSGTIDDYYNIYRIKKSGGKEKLLAEWADLYVIKGKRIYYRDIRNYDMGEGTAYYKSMKLNGKNKKITGIKVKNTHKKTNNNKYKVIKEEVKKGNSNTWEWDYWYYDYRLKMPKGKTAYLGREYIYKDGEEVV